MSDVGQRLATRREKSSWTPKNYPPANEKIFKERMTLIKKWYSAWDDSQRWVLVEYILKHTSDAQLNCIHTLLDPVVPAADHDFTRALPRQLCLKVFSYLDPRSLCRAAQVCCYWKYISEANHIWQPKCLRQGWFLPTPPNQFDNAAWKRHYVACVCQLHWYPPQSHDFDPVDPEDTTPQLASTVECRSRRRHTVSTSPRRLWRDPDRHPSDIHCRTEFLTAVPNSRRFSSLKCNGQTASSKKETAPRQPHRLQTPVETHSGSNASAWPTSPTLHPTLMEKLRLAAPAYGHEHSPASSDHHLKSHSPFPKLHSYYVHSTPVHQRDHIPVAPDEREKHTSFQAKEPLPVQPLELQTRPWNIPDFALENEQ